jgi:hypothetical protein
MSRFRERRRHRGHVWQHKQVANLFNDELDERRID